MIYNAGTISFSGNTVTGSGTNFTAPASQIRIGQTLLIASNPVQLVQITAINSASSLTVTPAASPAVSDQLYGIFVTDSLSVDGLAQSISQLINEYDENIGAWETFATTAVNQNVTVTINGQSTIIPAIGKLLQKGDNGALPVAGGGTGATDAAGARQNIGFVNDALPVAMGGTGATKAEDARSNLGLGDLATEKSTGIKKQVVKLDPQLGSSVELSVFTPGAGVKNGSGVVFKRSASDAYVIMQYNTSGDYEVSNMIMGIDTASRNVSWDFQLSGNAVANAGSWLSNSDQRIKKNIQTIENPLEKMRNMRGYTWDRLDNAPPGQGFIAQELMEVMPTAVFEGGRTELRDGTIVEKTLSVDVTGASAALHHEAILKLMDKNEAQQNEIKALEDRLGELEKLMSHSTNK